MTLEIILIILIFVLIFIIMYLLLKNDDKIDSQSLQMIQDQIINLNKNIDYKLSENNRNT
jgi:hypothetical protein